MELLLRELRELSDIGFWRNMEERKKGLTKNRSHHIIYVGEMPA